MRVLTPEGIIDPEGAGDLSPAKFVLLFLEIIPRDEAAPSSPSQHKLRIFPRNNRDIRHSSAFFRANRH
jgi:hypothetical protein